MFTGDERKKQTEKTWPQLCETISRTHPRSRLRTRGEEVLLKSESASERFEDEASASRQTDPEYVGWRRPTDTRPE